MRDQPLSTVSDSGNAGEHRDFYFLFSPLEELLENIAHAVQFTSGILAIEGVEKSGKTTLAKRLCDDYLTQCHQLAFLRAAPQADIQTLLSEVSNGFGLPAGEARSAGEFIAALRGFVQSLVAQSEVAILVIDDAQYLDQQTLAALASLLQGGDETVFGLHLVLLGEPGLVEQLDDLHLVDVLVHDFVVPPLPREELGEYISAMRDFYLYPPGCLEFTEGELNSLWSETHGVIGFVEVWVRRQLNSTPENVIAPPNLKPPPRAVAGLPLLHVCALGALVAVLLAALLARQLGVGESGGVEESGVSSERVHTPVELPADPEKNMSPAEENAEVAPAVEDLKPVVDDRELRNAIYGQEPARQAKSAVDAKTEEKKPEAEEKTKTETAATEELKDESASQPEAESTPNSTPESAEVQSTTVPARSVPAQPAKREPAPATQLPAPVATLSDDEQALLAFPGDSYSLQVMGASMQEPLARFREGQPNQKELYIYKTQRQGRDWFVLLAGNYPNREQAASAIAQLPKAQQSGGPWPRKLLTVHKEIAEDR